MNHPIHDDQNDSRNPIHSYVIWGVLGVIVGPIAGCCFGCKILMSTMGGDYWLAGAMYGAFAGLLAGPLITMGLRYLLMGRG